ncbi:MAG TPA: ROK family transcriptional regulator [Anaerolineaceae bacterium]
MRNGYFQEQKMIDRDDLRLVSSAEELPSARAHPSVTPLEMEILTAIRRDGELTKAHLVLSTLYSRSKINGCISALLKKNYIKAAGPGDYTGGRRSLKFSLSGDLGLVAGVDIGATSFDLLLADMTGKVYARCSEPGTVREGPLPVLERISGLLEKMVLESGWTTDRLLGVGIGVPGPVDFARGMLVSPPIMPGWDGFPIIQTVQKRFPSARAVVDNDVNVMALGEQSRGESRKHDNSIFVKIGTGIGAGIICNGRIYRGTNGCAGDIGHISVKKDGPLCPCGNRGCLEAMAAGPAIAERGVQAVLEGRSSILQKYYEANGQALRAEDVGRGAGEGDPASIDIIRESGQMIGDVLASLVNFHNPGAIVIGGGVSNLGNLLLSSIRQAVLNRSLPLATRDLRIVFSATGVDAGVFGAVALANENVFMLES